MAIPRAARRTVDHLEERRPLHREDDLVVPLTEPGRPDRTSGHAERVGRLRVIQAGLRASMRNRDEWATNGPSVWTACTGARDATYGEDLSQPRTASGPHVMATLRNLALTILRLTGAANLAAALRHHSRRPSRPLQTLIST